MLVPHLLQDLRYTLRSLRRNSGFAVFAILIAGLGVGASSTVFSVVNTLLLRPLPFEKPSELVWIANRDLPDLSGQTTQVGYLLDLRERTQTMSAVAAYFAFYGVGDNLLSGRGEPERLSGVPVSENFFDVLGVKPMLGRSFDAKESAWNGPKAVMLGYGLWERRFNRDPAIVGTSLVINDEPHTVVGVLPAVVRLRHHLRAGQPLRSLLPVSAQPRDQSLGQHPGDDRPAEARRDRGARARRSPRARAADEPRASGAQRLRGPRHAVVGARQRRHPACRLRPRRRRGDGHADRLRQPVEPAAGTDGGTTERDRDPHGARCRTEAAGGPDAHRRPRPVVERRRPRPGARGRRYSPPCPARWQSASRCCTTCASTRPRSCSPCRHADHGRRLRPDAGAAGVGRRHDQRPAETRAAVPPKAAIGPSCATRWSCRRSRSRASCWWAPGS